MKAGRNRPLPRSGAWPRRHGPAAGTRPQWSGPRHASDGVTFANRIGDVFQMADSSTAALVGPVVFMPNEEGVQTRAMWLESG